MTATYTWGMFPLFSLTHKMCIGLRDVTLQVDGVKSEGSKPPPRDIFPPPHMVSKASSMHKPYMRSEKCCSHHNTFWLHTYSYYINVIILTSFVFMRGWIKSTSTHYIRADYA